MRVVAGTYRGLNLLTPEDQAVRPTLNHVKEAVFSMAWSHGLKGTFLDLFAGSGGIGIEAISRGYGPVVMVEKNRAHEKLVRANLAKCKGAEAQVLNMDCMAALGYLKGMKKQFDVVYLDPPFDAGFIGKVLPELYDGDLLTEDALVFCEHSANEPVPEAYRPYIIREKRYGIIHITLLGKEPQNQ